MRILVNVFHPNLSTSRVNQRWMRALADQPGVTIHPVYERYPTWEIDVDYEKAMLLAHDRIVFQHPFLWYSTPPLMKKWLDEVLTYGWAYGPGGHALRGKEWMSAISTGGPATSYQAGGYNSYAMSEFLKPLQQTANLTGMTFLPAFVLHVAVEISPHELEASAEAIVKHVCDPEVDPNVRLANLLQRMEMSGVDL